MAKRNGSHRQRLLQIRTKAGGGAYQPWLAGQAAERGAEVWQEAQQIRLEKALASPPA